MEADAEDMPTWERACGYHAWGEDHPEGYWPCMASRCSGPGEGVRLRRLSVVARKVQQWPSLVPVHCSSDWQYEAVPRLAAEVAGEAVGAEDNAEEAVFVLSLVPDLPDPLGPMGRLDPMDLEVVSDPGTAASAAPVEGLAGAGTTQELGP